MTPDSVPASGIAVHASGIASKPAPAASEKNNSLSDRATHTRMTSVRTNAPRLSLP